MNENELHERYIRLAFQYESAIDALLTKGLVDIEAADAAKERFYDTLNEEKLRTTQKIRDYMKLQLVIGSDLTWELVGYIKRGQFRAPVSDSMKLFPDDSGAKIAHKRFTRDIFLFHCLKNCQIIRNIS